MYFLINSIAWESVMVQIWTIMYEIFSPKSSYIKGLVSGAAGFRGETFGK